MNLIRLPVFQAFLAGTFTTVITVLGSLFVFIGKTLKNTTIAFIETFSAGIMISASFFSLLLPALSYEGYVPNYISICLSFLLGGCLLWYGDVIFSKRIGKSGVKNDKTKLLFMAVTLHNIPEGLAVGVAFSGDLLGAMILTFGIAIQNFPEGTCVALPLYASGKSKKSSFLFSVLSGAIELPCAVIGCLLSQRITGFMPWILGLSAGAMIGVSVSELLPENFQNNKRISMLGVLIGFFVMMFLDIALG